MKSEEGTQELDLSGLNCPLPVLKTKKKLSSMDTGEKLLLFVPTKVHSMTLNISVIIQAIS